MESTQKISCLHQRYGISEEVKKDTYEALIRKISACKDPEEPPKELALRLADALRQAGLLCYDNASYPKSFEFTKQMLLPALNLYLYAIGASELFVDLCEDELNSLLKLENYIHDMGNRFTVVDVSLAQLGNKEMQMYAQNVRLSPEDQFAFANTVRWLNKAYRASHESSQCPEEDKVVRVMRHAKLLELAADLLNIGLPSAEKDSEFRELLKDITAFLQDQKDEPSRELIYGNLYKYHREAIKMDVLD